MPWPTPAIPNKYHLVLAQIVAATSWLPDPKVVTQFPGPVFPTIRKKSDDQIRQEVIENTQVIGMYDNNTTPKLALGLTHGKAGSTKGWTIAHVWPSSEDIQSYTHLANLALVPEALSTTTDKEAPLTSYLRWHAWTTYRWRPHGTRVPVAPEDYSKVEWHYLNGVQNPRQKVAEYLRKSKDQRLIKLRTIMEELKLIEPRKHPHAGKCRRWAAPLHINIIALSTSFVSNVFHWLSRYWRGFCIPARMS